MSPSAYRLTPSKGLSPKAAWCRISDSSNASSLGAFTFFQLVRLFFPRREHVKHRYIICTHSLVQMQTHFFVKLSDFKRKSLRLIKNFCNLQLDQGKRQNQKRNVLSLAGLIQPTKAPVLSSLLGTGRCWFRPELSATCFRPHNPTYTAEAFADS